MDTRIQQQRMAGGVAPADVAGQARPPMRGRAHLPASCGADAIPDNKRIRELLGWGLIPANGALLHGR